MQSERVRSEEPAIRESEHGHRASLPFFHHCSSSSSPPPASTHFHIEELCLSVFQGERDSSGVEKAQHIRS